MRADSSTTPVSSAHVSHRCFVGGSGAMRSWHVPHACDSLHHDRLPWLHDDAEIRVCESAGNPRESAATARCAIAAADGVGALVKTTVGGLGPGRPTVTSSHRSNELVVGRFACGKADHGSEAICGRSVHDEVCNALDNRSDADVNTSDGASSVSEDEPTALVEH